MYMGKKFGFYFSLFLIVLLVNLYVAFALHAKNRRLEASKRILNEIDAQADAEKAFGYSSAPFVAGSYEGNVNTSDARARVLKSFFRRYNSTLYDYAEYIVKISDKYRFDYRLLPAIAMQESNLCKYIPPGSHNCWGWGIYGDLVTKFSTYEDAIDTVAQGIKDYYIDQGLVTASSIMAKYTPSSNGSWARGVNTVLRWIE